MGSDDRRYLQLPARLAAFYRDHPDGSVQTLLVHYGAGEAVFEARVFRSREDARHGIYVSGWAREREDEPSGSVGTALERGEAAAILRALAHLGYGDEGYYTAGDPEATLDATLAFIRRYGPTVPDQAEVLVDGQLHLLKAYVRQHWRTIKAQPALARRIAAAIRRALEPPYRRAA